MEEGTSREEQLAQLEVQLQQERSLLTGLESMTCALFLLLYTYATEYRCDELKCCSSSCVAILSNLAGALCMLAIPDLNNAGACSRIMPPPQAARVLPDPKYRDL